MSQNTVRGASSKKKLIEVALPLEAINKASVEEKNIRGGHPANLHLWWARRPLAACRAVLFASLVDDPSSEPDRFPTLKAQEDERNRLFRIIEGVVRWQDADNESAHAAPRAEVLRCSHGHLPPVVDPFCGGGSIPLEAQRLGLQAQASDLNPVAVLITKSLIEIPAKFAGQAPVHPDARRGVGGSGAWQGASGLAEDVRRYGAWMRDEAERLVGHLYPKSSLPVELGGGQATVIAWLWARTVTCPNPACGSRMPLVRSFGLSMKKGRETWIEPVVDRAKKSVDFTIRTGRGSAPEGTVGRAGARCIVCESPVPLEYVRSEGRAGRMGIQLMAVAVEGLRARAYLAPTARDEEIARSASPDDVPETELPDQALGFRVQAYGMTRHRDLFTSRQLVGLSTFSDLIAHVRERVFRDATAAGMPADGEGLAQGGHGAAAYADALATYLAFVEDKILDLNCTISRWKLDRECTVGAFARQAIPMTWDFPESNPLSSSAGSWSSALDLFVRSFGRDSMPAIDTGSHAEQRDVLSPGGETGAAVVSTDPPYYDNIGYADLSDFFYVWLRRSLSSVHPALFRTVLTPKADELVATPFRFGGDRKKAGRHFEAGLGSAFARLRAMASADYPLTIYYAFKQAESDEGSDAVASTGWETMLEGLLSAGLSIEGTWPMRTEMATRQVASGTNALASSIVLVCRPRATAAGITDRRGFLAALQQELPDALRTLQHGNIAPVDLAQASIGPGMAVFSRFGKVVEPDGAQMTVRTALGIINSVLSEVLSEQEDEFDNDTRWAVTWFEQHAHRDGKFGDAEVLSKAKNTGVNALRTAGIIADGAGKVRLKQRAELDASWDPTTDKRLTVWEVTQHLIRTLGEGGEPAAADLVRRVGGLADTARDLAYRLYSICERKKWADEALGYNALVTAWPEITRLAASTQGNEAPQQTQLFT
jgi:putative DNA methylase